MRYEVRKMPSDDRWYVNDTVTGLDVRRRWPQNHIMRTWGTLAAAERAARTFEKDDAGKAFEAERLQSL